MRYQLDTIPVWDAYKAGGECPAMRPARSKTRKCTWTAFSALPSWEPDTRVEVNEKGFCPEHYRQMFAQKNRLGLALIMHTHMKEVISSLDSILDGAASASGGGLLRRLTPAKGEGGAGSRAARTHGQVHPL